MLCIREPPERIINANTYKNGSKIQNPSNDGEEMMTFESAKSKSWNSVLYIF